MKWIRDILIMNKDFQRIEKLHNCKLYETKKGEQEFIELHTLNAFTKNNLIHIEHILKQYGYYFYMIEAMDDYLMITYYKK